MSADTFAEKFQEAISGINAEDEIILLGEYHWRFSNDKCIRTDFIKKGWRTDSSIWRMNLARQLTATLMKDDVDTELLKDSLISEAKNAIKEFVLDSGADDEEDEI